MRYGNRLKAGLQLFGGTLNNFDNMLFDPNRQAPMHIIPWDSFEIVSSQSREALIRRLEEHTEPPAVISSPIRRSTTGFEGRVDADRFQVVRLSIVPIVRLPELHGRVVSDGDGTRLQVQMVPDTLLVLLQAGLFAVLSVTMFDTSLQVFWFAGAMIALAWFLNVSGFWFDCGESRRLLEAIAQADAPSDSEHA